MLKQKLSLVKYETAFVPPKINFRQKQTNKKNKHLSNALLPLVLGQIRTSWNSFRLVAKNPVRSRSQFLFCL